MFGLCANWAIFGTNKVLMDMEQASKRRRSDREARKLRHDNNMEILMAMNKTGFQTIDGEYTVIDDIKAKS
jgi:hypothetical protein